MSKTRPPVKKKNHHLRKLLTTVAIAGATYAAEKYIQSRQNKKKAGQKN